MIGVRSIISPAEAETLLSAIPELTVEVNSNWNKRYQENLLGLTVEFPQQGFALLALIPIWLYRGRQGYHSRWVQTACYLFYPVHILVLAMMVRFLL